MDTSELAQKMLEWEKAKATLDALTMEIKEAVFVAGKTQTVGNVRATYGKGRKSYNYEEATQGHPMVSDTTITLFTTTPEPEPRVDWRKVCKHVGIDEIPFTQSEPSVSIKLLN